MAQLLGNVTVGSIVKLNENGSPVDYLVVHQGKPSSLYDDSCDGTWLLRKDIYAEQQWNSSNNNTFTSVTVNTTYLPSLLALYDTNIQSVIKTVKIPYCVGGGSTAVNSGTNGFSCQLFLLSGYEVGFSGESPYLPIDGAKLSYFEIGTGNSAIAKRIAKLNDNFYTWHLRSPVTDGSYGMWWVGNNGYANSGNATTVCGIRPAMIMPSNLWVLEDGSISIIGIPTLTAPTTVVQAQSISLSWSSVSGATSYQLQRNIGSSWETIYTGPNTSYEDTAGNWSSVQYQVCALVDTIQGAYSDPQTVTIIQPSAVPTINSISTVNLTESFTITWNSAANADSYVLQRNIGSGWEEVYSGANLQYQDQALYSNMSYRVASVITDLYQSAWSPEYTVDINGQMIEMNVKNADGSYETIYPKTLIGNIAGIEDQYYTKQESLQSNVATLIGLTNQAVPNDMFNILAHAGDLHVWKRTIDGNTDYPVSVNKNAYQEGSDLKPAGYTLGEIQSGQFQITPVGMNATATYKRSTSILVLENGQLSFPETADTYTAKNLNAQPEYMISAFAGHFIQLQSQTQSFESVFTGGEIFYIPPGTTMSKINQALYLNQYQSVTGYPAITEGTTIEYMGQLGGFGNKAQIEIGSYIGTGASGESNYNSLTLNFDPQVVFISCANSSPNFAMIVCTSKTTFFRQFGIVIRSGGVYDLYSSCMNKVLNFYTTRGAEYQMNDSGRIYNYIALG